MAKINISIKSNKKIYYENPADIIIIKTNNGEMGVMANHISCVAMLVKSKIKIINNSKQDFININGGIAYIKNNKILILEL